MAKLLIPHRVDEQTAAWAQHFHAALQGDRKVEHVLQRAPVENDGVGLLELVGYRRIEIVDDASPFIRRCVHRVHAVRPKPAEKRVHVSGRLGEAGVELAKRQPGGPKRVAGQQAP